MSRFIEENGDGYNVVTLDDKTKCAWMYNEVCCNDKTDYLADYPDRDDCAECPYFKKETMKANVRKIVSIMDPI